MQIDLPLFLHSDQKWVVVEAELLPDLAPHLADVATFAVHRMLHVLRGMSMRYYTVANLESGLGISKRGDTKAKVIETAREFLATKTPEDILRRYEAWGSIVK